MKTGRYEPEYWSSCCGERVEYIGFYRCGSCHERALFGARPAVAADEAAGIRERLETGRQQEKEAEACGRLF